MAFPKLTAEELGEHLRVSGKTGIALDIDDTLSLTEMQWFTYMSERCGNPENLSPREILKKYRDVRKVPYWDPALVEASVEEFFTSHDFNSSIPLIHGVDEAVRQVDAIVPIVAYITARPEEIHETTVAWLTRHGFPEAPIVFRPRGGTIATRSTWKAGVLHALYPLVGGFVDDHPHLAEQLSGLGYKGNLYLYDHGDNVNIYDAKDVLRSWDEIIARMRENFAEI